MFLSHKCAILYTSFLHLPEGLTRKMLHATRSPASAWDAISDALQNLRYGQQINPCFVRLRNIFLASKWWYNALPAETRHISSAKFRRADGSITSPSCMP